MAVIREVDTITSKAQITLPRPISQALGVDVGGKVAFELVGDRVIVTRVADVPHEDPAISRFLSLLEKDLQSGRHRTTLADDLARLMLARNGKAMDLNEDIEGDVVQ